MADTSSTSSCINPLPDIEGLGTRVSTYAQILLSILTIALAPQDGGAYDAWWTILVTSLGLQIAAIAKTGDLDFYHALLVTWLAYPVFAMSWVFIFLHWREAGMPFELLLVTHIHGFVFIALGLWIWLQAHTFSLSPDQNCSNDDVQFVVFGRSIKPTGWFRDLVLAIFFLWAFLFIVQSLFAFLRLIPFISRWYHKSRFHHHITSKFFPNHHHEENGDDISRPPLNPMARNTPNQRQTVNNHLHTYSNKLKQELEVDIHNAEQMIGPTPRVRIPTTPRTVAGVTLFNLFMLVLSIASVEQMIDRNENTEQRSTDSGRASWSFGQILAMILLVGPVFAFVRLLKDRFMEFHQKRVATHAPIGSPVRARAERNFQNLERREARDIDREKTLLGMRPLGNADEKGTPDGSLRNR